VLVGGFTERSIGTLRRCARSILRHRSWPIEALLERVPDKGPGRSVMPTDPTMDILQQLFPLFD
jgi:hypothetical protein